MSEVIADIKSMIKQLGEAGAYEIMDGTVESVDEGKWLVAVRIDEDLVLPGIKLRAVSNDNDGGLICVPKVGSYVVFAMLRGQSNYVLIQTSELDKVIVVIEKTKLVVNNEGFEISRAGISMVDVMKSLHDLIMNLKVTTPSGPSTNLLPDSITALTDFQTKFKSILK